MNQIAVIGAGTMGIGIAQVAASAGNNVLLHDAFSDVLSRSMVKLESTFNRLVDKGKFTKAEAIEILSRIKPAYNLSELMHSDLVIEAVVEDIEVKRKIFKALENVVNPNCVLASNTSSLSIASIAASCNMPERVIGIHFFNPAPVMKLVELVPAIQTSEEVTAKCLKVLENWGKVVAVAKDTPGFIVNRVARPFYGEALRIYEEGLADFQTIDHAMKSIGGFRMGPFELMDFIGNDVNYAVTESVFHAFYFDPRYKPSFTQKRLSEAGYFGRKSGRGYYDYQEGAISNKPNETEGLLRQIFERILVMLINEAADALFLNVASAKDIDNAMLRGVNYPKGLLAWADEFGIDRVVESLDALYDEYHEDRYRCSALLRRMNRQGKTFFN